MKVLSTLLYYAGLSQRVAPGFASAEAPALCETVRLWRTCLREATSKPRLRRRRMVAVNDTKLKLNGRQLHLSAAVDVGTHEVSDFKVSWQRSSLEALLFMLEVLRLSRNKPLFLVEGAVVPVGFHVAGLEVQTHDVCITQQHRGMFSLLKARTKRFYDNFPNGSSLKSVQTYLAIHTTTYNLLQGLT